MARRAGLVPLWRQIQGLREGTVTVEEIEALLARRDAELLARVEALIAKKIPPGQAKK